MLNLHPSPNMSNPNSLPPGFRFHPTDEELILHYLRKRAESKPFPLSIIAEVDIYKFDPWNLPAKAKLRGREWYFFSPRDRKYPNGVRPNRAAVSGYWKATGTDKPIYAGNENIGVKKALVFYTGRPPKGLKTNWIMHEYRLAEAGNSNSYKPVKLRDHSMRLDDWVLCRIYKKNNSLSSVPALMDQEQEDSCNEDPYLPPTLQNITQESSTLKHQKSSSISDLLEDYASLSHLFDTQPEFNSLLAANQGSNQLFVSGSSVGNGSSYLVPQRFETESAGMRDQSSPSKRQRINTQGYPEASKKQNDSDLMTNFSNQFDGPQYSFLNQQLLLNSPFGLH